MRRNTCLYPTTTLTQRGNQKVVHDRLWKAAKPPRRRLGCALAAQRTAPSRPLDEATQRAGSHQWSRPSPLETSVYRASWRWRRSSSRDAYQAARTHASDFTNLSPTGWCRAKPACLPEHERPLNQENEHLLLKDHLPARALEDGDA